jgi:hypothetical protein
MTPGLDNLGKELGYFSKLEEYKEFYSNSEDY